MSLAPAPAALSDLAVGSTVIVKRNLDHPAHKRQVVDEHGESRFVPDETIEETVGTVGVIDRRDVPAIAGWGGREATSLVRLANGLWYDLTDGYQRDCRATLIQPV